MTKLEICAMEASNPGVVYLYPEGSFYKAYQQSASTLACMVRLSVRSRIKDQVNIVILVKY